MLFRSHAPEAHAEAAHEPEAHVEPEHVEEVHADEPAVVPAGVDPEATIHTTVIIQGVPGFSRASHLQRTIQQVAGVSDAKANGYERGILTLDVAHQAKVVVKRALLRLDGMRLRVVEEGPGTVTLQTEL